MVIKATHQTAPSQQSQPGKPEIQHCHKQGISKISCNTLNSAPGSCLCRQHIPEHRPHPATWYWIIPEHDPQLLKHLISPFQSMNSLNHSSRFIHFHISLAALTFRDRCREYTFPAISGSIIPRPLKLSLCSRSRMNGLNCSDLNHSSFGVPKPILSFLSLIFSGSVPLIASLSIDLVIPFLMKASPCIESVLSTSL